MEKYEDIIALSSMELVKWCKKRKESMDYSNQDLSEMTGVPIGTVDRIMAGKYTEYKYSSIQPIVQCLLGYGAETPKPEENTDQSKYYYETIKGYQLVVENKNKEIEQLKEAYGALFQIKDRLEKENDCKERHITFLEDLIDKLGIKQK